MILLNSMLPHVISATVLNRLRHAGTVAGLQRTDVKHLRPRVM